MSISFILMVASASTLPLLSLLAIFLRRNFFKGKLKIVFLVFGLILLGFAIFDSLIEHSEELGMFDVVITTITALTTFYILSHFSHTHTHNKNIAGAKGIVISEAFHSLFDGMVIGMTYLINPILGYSATLGILVHEAPKILGTLALFRSMGLSVKKTILYGLWAQSGSPVAAILVYVLGKKFDHEQFHAFEIASISSLAAIVLWIIYLEIRFHLKHDKHTHQHHDGHPHS